VSDVGSETSTASDIIRLSYENNAHEADL